MTQLNELRIINDSNILYLKKINKSYERNEIIKNILDDEACFFKMNKDDAYFVLQEIGILDDQIDTVYKKLISYDEFYNLYKRQKINLDDEEILIKYQIYNPDDLFKNSKNKKDEIIQKDITPAPYKESLITKLINKLKELLGK